MHELFTNLNSVIGTALFELLESSTIETLKDQSRDGILTIVEDLDMYREHMNVEC